MLRILLTGILILALQGLYAQGKIVVYGKVTDNYGEPLVNVNILEKGTRNGSASRSDGTFTIVVKDSSSMLLFTHVACINKQVKAGNQSLKVVMERKAIEIGSAEVSGNRVVNLVEKKFFDVVDFEFYQENILLLTWCYKEKCNPWLVLMSPTGDTLARTCINQEGSLYRDCMDNPHIIGKDSAWQVFIDENNKFTLLYPMNADTFISILGPCITSLGEKLFLRQYSWNNQVLSYVVADTISKQYSEVRVIADDRALRMLGDRGKFYSMGAVAPSEADLRFEEMCFFSPIYAPLVKLGDRVAIFNFVDGNIEYYNNEGISLKDVPFTFHKAPNWKKEVICDEVTGKIYAAYRKNGITTLRVIDPETGTEGREIQVPNFKYIEKMKARNGYLYFLYRQNSPLELMKLYKMDL